jgi:hypothetical protein
MEVLPSGRFIVGACGLHKFLANRVPKYDIEVDGDGGLIIREITRESGINMIDMHIDNCMMTIDSINPGESRGEMRTGNIIDNLQIGESDAKSIKPLNSKQKRRLCYRRNRMKRDQQS